MVTKNSYRVWPNFIIPYVVMEIFLNIVTGLYSHYLVRSLIVSESFNKVILQSTLSGIKYLIIIIIIIINIINSNCELKSVLVYIKFLRKL